MILSKLSSIARRAIADDRRPGVQSDLRQYTMCDAEAIASLQRLSRYVVLEDIQGDIVECGVCNGGTAAVIASNVRSTDRKLWLYDSFEGMPETQPIDGEDASRYVGKCVGSEIRVREALERVSFSPQRVVVRAGWFDRTFQESLPETVSLLHIDADWYDSVFSSLRAFYPLVSEGGVIVLDDFGYWEGCREAFYAFCQSFKIAPLLERAGNQQAFWIKGKQHNRA